MTILLCDSLVLTLDGALIAWIVGLSLCTGAMSCVATSVITQFSGYVKFKFTIQLNKGVWRVLQKLLEYFNDAAILTSFLLWFGVIPVRVEFRIFFFLYSIKLYTDITISKSSVLSIKV